MEKSKRYDKLNNFEQRKEQKYHGVASVKNIHYILMEITYNTNVHKIILICKIINYKMQVIYFFMS